MITTDFDPRTVETDVVAAIRAASPEFFEDLLSDGCLRQLDGHEALGIRIDPLIGSMRMERQGQGLSFSTHARLHAGVRQIDVLVIGNYGVSGPTFSAVERAYGRQGPGSPSLDQGRSTDRRERCQRETDRALQLEIADLSDEIDKIDLCADLPVVA